MMVTLNLRTHHPASYAADRVFDIVAYAITADARALSRLLALSCTGPVLDPPPRRRP